MQEIITNNKVAISGEIVSNAEFSHEVFGEKFYLISVACKRTSGQEDFLPVIISDRMINVECELVGIKVKINGQIRSYNRHDADKNRLIISVFAREIEFLNEGENEGEKDDDVNAVELDGYICKQPSYRQTPLGREICDILLAVNRPYGKLDYIPCIVWGRNARFTNRLEVGTRVVINGRTQSRTYNKKIDEEHTKECTAYEVSVSKLEVVKNEGQSC